LITTFVHAASAASPTGVAWALINAPFVSATQTRQRVLRR